MELLNVDTLYSRVVQSTDWLDLEKYEGLEGKTGVFIFSSFFFQVKYVGRAGAGDMVSKISEAIKKGKATGSTKIKVIYTTSEKHAITLEKKLILRYHPAFNLK